jgi:hypothetical protein
MAWASLIHAPHGQAQPRRLGVGLLDQRFFCDSIRIVDLDLDHHSATLATPHGRTRLAPAPIALPTQASLVQDAPDRVAADEGQAIRGATQSALQRGQRPGGGAIALAVRRSVELGQDALLGHRVVQHGRSASVAWLERRQPLPIEQTDQGRDRVARPTTGQLSRRGIRVTIGHRQQHLGASDERGWQTEGSTETLQVRPFLWTERSERVLFESRHEISGGQQENRAARRV